MNQTGILYDERFFLHNTGEHLETELRLKAVYDGIMKSKLKKKLKIFKAVNCTQYWLEKTHDKNYLEAFQKACENRSRTFGSNDNIISPQTYETATLAAGGILGIVNLIMTGKLNNAFCPVRPPGHHAGYDKAQGYCFINNIAVAARFLQEKWALDKIAIVDFDAHHGNGTQQIFEQDPGVLFCSIHADPLFSYPFSGYEEEKGTGPGLGYTLNCPVKPDERDKNWKKVIKNKIFPALEEFKPQFILVSAGFDAFEFDVMSKMRITRAGFIWLEKKLIKLARKYSQKRIIFILEGGYCMNRLPDLAADLTKSLLKY
ncbi:MAG: histone deacetylase [Candidatus Cloacimonetes bacterium]|nr:histone deacetylase [Candidatus Cloacimonadota bacterium]